MNLLIYISYFIVPFIILSIVIYGLLSGINVYDTFIQGARSGFLTVIRLMPTLIGLMAATGILRASGFLDLLADFIGQFSSLAGFPGELVPLTIVRMFSSSAATGLLLDIYENYGTDSRIGLIAVSIHVLHGNDLLYHERIFHDRRDPQITLYACRSAYCDIRRTGCKRTACIRLGARQVRIVRKDTL